MKFIDMQKEYTLKKKNEYTLERNGGANYFFPRYFATV